MDSIENLRNSIIDKLLTISNQDYLVAIQQVLENSAVDTDLVKLTEDQIKMLMMSEEDIKNNRLISQENVDQSDLKWLKGKCQN